MTVRSGVAAFVIMSVVAMGGVYLYTAAPGSAAELPRRVVPGYLALCVLVVPLVDWLVAGARLWLFASVLAPRVTYAACVRNCAVGAFMGAATPSQTGGGVAQVYVLVKEGATLAESLSLLFMTFLSTLLFYFLASVALSAAIGRGAIPGLAPSGGFLLAASLFGGLSALGLLALFRPAATRRSVARLSSWLRRRRIAARFADRAGEVLDRCGDSIERIARLHRLRLLASVGLSAAVFGNKYFAGYLAARALGVRPPVLETLYVQAFLNVLLYFFPTPGASGGAEVTAAVLMAPLVPQWSLAPLTLLWRTSTSYLSVVVGGILLVRYLRREAAVTGEGR